jgi:Kef-type K+ transport system membrane component KefB
LPKVTAYLMVGLLAGPSFFHGIAGHHVDSLRHVTEFAMALVLFMLGCHFPLAHIRRVLRRALILSFGELTCTFVLVTIGLMFVGPSWEFALLMGALALATAPATTILVLQESASEGPVTEYASTLVALNNFASIVLFEVIFLGIHIYSGEISNSLLFEISRLASNIFGSILLGAGAGLAMSYGCGLLNRKRWLVLLIATAAAVLGSCETLGIPYMLAFLTMGIVVVNSSEISSNIVDELKPLTSLLCVLFFAVHGAELKLDDLRAVGLIGIVYIICRVLGKCLGTAFAAKAVAEQPQVRVWLGPTLLAQAGAAIALSEIAVQRNPELGKSIQTVVLGTVVFFEIIGPILIRQSVLRAGEVPLGQAVRHTTVTPLSHLLSMWNQILTALGLNPARRLPPAELTVGDLMRKNIRAISESANFDEIIHVIEHSHDNTYPVVDEQHSVVGVISYPLLSTALFDKKLGSLVRAQDLAVPSKRVLHPTDPAINALEAFRRVTDDCIPVVELELPNRLLGIVRRSDVMNMLIHNQKSQ